MEYKYKRIILKVSGEALSGSAGHGINEEIVTRISNVIKNVNEIGVEVAVVVGGGNFWRGASAREMDRTTSDYMGINADIILLAKNGVDGVYSDDPKKNPDSVKYDELKYIDVLNKGLKIMDSTATSLCMDNKIPILVFGIEEPENIEKIVMGNDIGTIIKEV